MRKGGRELAKKNVKGKKIQMMVNAMKKVVSWKKLKVTLAQAVREGFLEKVTFEL